MTSQNISSAIKGGKLNAVKLPKLSSQPKKMYPIVLTNPPESKYVEHDFFREDFVCAFLLNLVPKKTTKTAHLIKDPWTYFDLERIWYEVTAIQINIKIKDSKEVRHPLGSDACLKKKKCFVLFGTCGAGTGVFWLIPMFLYLVTQGWRDVVVYQLWCSFHQVI